MRALLLLVLLSSTASADEWKPFIPTALEDNEAVAAALRTHYTKHEYKIAMRDGVHLYTVAYVPKGEGPWPVLMLRTPYGVGPYGVDNLPKSGDDSFFRHLAPCREAVQAGYIFVHQDVRGRLMSEGSFVDVRPYDANKRGPKDIDETTDTYDTIDFLVKHLPRNNGKVGLWGISYPGFYAAIGAVDAHPALKAVSPQAPVTDWFVGDDFHHNGALFLADAYLFYSVFGQPRPKPRPDFPQRPTLEAGDLYEFFLRLGPISNAVKSFPTEIPFWNDLVAHPTLDEFWRARNPRPFYKKLRPAVMTVGGWFDAEDLYGALATYRAIEQQSPGAENVLVMGPWMHGGWGRTEGDSHGDLRFGAKTSHWFQTEVELPFFERHLRGRATLPRPAEATIFETGTNEWRRHEVWPPRAMRPTTVYLSPGGKLSVKTPATGVDAYLSDPAHPVPFTEDHGLRREPGYMSEDQRFASRRPDVLSYVSEPLTADVALAGPIEADLWVSTTGTDADFIVKLVDVYPSTAAPSEVAPHTRPMAGYEQLVRGEVMRGKFRDSLSTPKAFVPNEPTRVRFTLPDVSHCFRVGHRIAVQVQSSWFPLVDRNPQRFVDIYKATEADFRAETQRVLLGGKTPSTIKLPLLRGSLP